MKYEKCCEVPFLITWLMQSNPRNPRILYQNMPLRKFAYASGTKRSPLTPSVNAEEPTKKTNKSKGLIPKYDIKAKLQMRVLRSTFLPNIRMMPRKPQRPSALYQKNWGKLLIRVEQSALPQHADNSEECTKSEGLVSKYDVKENYSSEWCETLSPNIRIIPRSPRRPRALYQNMFLRRIIHARGAKRSPLAYR